MSKKVKDRCPESIFKDNRHEWQKVGGFDAVVVEACPRCGATRWTVAIPGEIGCRVYRMSEQR